MLKIYEKVVSFITITIIFQAKIVFAKFERNAKHLEEISQIFSNNNLRDHLILYPAETIDGHWDPKSVFWYSVIENNVTNKFRKSFDDERRLGRGLLRMPSHLEGRTGLVDYTVRSGRIKIIKKKKRRKKKKKKRFKIKGAEHHLKHLVLWAKIMFSKYMVSLLIAFKLKFLAIFPVLATGLFLVVGSAGLAGFFFALLIASMGLKGWTNPP